MKELSIEERVEIAINQCKETIKCQEMKMTLAEKKTITRNGYIIMK